ncbi:pinin-like [Ipomoea triloba]|uniref:pinin-like n=1 Tax=Ipomoea triloba TaxID=35885 RepID=UPI00125D30A4|nr:pinin-like [Ipomoea triloba]
MDQDESQYFDFAKLTNRYPSEIQHQASREMVMIINNKIKPPGGEPIWSWYSRAEQLDYLKGFLKPLAAETGQSTKTKENEEIIVLSDTEEETNQENIAVEKTMPLISVKQEPVDDSVHDTSIENTTVENTSVHDKNLSLSVDTNQMTAVDYGPYQLEPPASLFSKLDLFNILDEHRRSASLVNRLSIPVTIPQTENPSLSPVLSLPSSQPRETEKTTQPNPEKSLSTQSEESHTVEIRLEPPAEKYPETNPANPTTEPDLSPLVFEIECETGNIPEIQNVGPANEEDNLPLSQVKKIKEKAKGKKKVQQEQADEQPVQKIQVFPVSTSRRRTRSSSTAEQKEKETPSPVRTSKRKQPPAEQTAAQEATDSKKRKKSILAKSTQSPLPESQPEVSVVAPVGTISPQFLSDEFAARWDSTNQRKILSERFLDAEKFKSQCQLMPVFEKLNLAKSVTSLKSYPPITIKEFYANLMLTIKEAGSSQYGRVWLRGNE